MFWMNSRAGALLIQVEVVRIGSAVLVVPERRLVELSSGGFLVAVVVARPVCQAAGLLINRGSAAGVARLLDAAAVVDGSRFSRVTRRA